MGIGFPEDLVVSVALGADLFDCVWPTRTARFGNAITSRGSLNLRHSSFANDFSPIAGDCACVCVVQQRTEVWVSRERSSIILRRRRR